MRPAADKSKGYLQNRCRDTGQRCSIHNGVNNRARAIWPASKAILAALIEIQIRPRV